MQAAMTEEGFAAKGFPNCQGAMDVTHVSVSLAKMGAELLHSYYSVIM
jgi:hypothetical protein